MRIINGLKYTVVDQFKILAITIASVFAIFLGIVALFASNSNGFRSESYPVFIMLSFVLMIFMGVGYAPVYFRTLVQGGFTRKEIFIIQIITDIVILFSGGIMVFFSILPIIPVEVFRAVQIYFVDNFINIIGTAITGVMATRTLFNCFGLIINKFNNRFAGTVVGVTVYFLFGMFSRATSGLEIHKFIEHHGLIFSVLYLACLLVIEFFIIKTHNSKPISK